MNSLRILFHRIIDYAGLFPPAELAMLPAVRNYAAYRREDRSWMLGRFILPVSRLEEFEVASASCLLRNEETEPWLLSVLAGGDLDAALSSIVKFNRRHAEVPAAGPAVIDTIELKAFHADVIDRSLASIPHSLTAYVEIPVDKDPQYLVRVIAQGGGRAKVRTGGVAPGSTPSAADLTRFMEACLREGIPFKATAGLHHPLRSADQHGFLSLFLAAAFLRAGFLPQESVRVLEEKSLDAFQFTDGGISWSSHHIHNDLLSSVRQRFAIAFGSCSFREPVDDLQAMNLI